MVRGIDDNQAFLCCAESKALKWIGRKRCFLEIPFQPSLFSPKKTKIITKPLPDTLLYPPSILVPPRSGPKVGKRCPIMPQSWNVDTGDLSSRLCGSDAHNRLANIQSEGDQGRNILKQIEVLQRVRHTEALKDWKISLPQVNQVLASY